MHFKTAVDEFLICYTAALRCIVGQQLDALLRTVMT